jgi:hypothetical protein
MVLAKIQNKMTWCQFGRYSFDLEKADVFPVGYHKFDPHESVPVENVYPPVTLCLH